MRRAGFIGGKFLPLHQGHVYAITQAACMCDELYVILSHSKSRDRRLCAGSKIKDIPVEIRLRWLTQLARDMENVRVLAVEDEYDSDQSYNWEEGARQIRSAIGKRIDVVFSSEPGYDPIFRRLYPEAEHVILDAGREQFPISATQIREDGPFRHWEFIPEWVRPFFVKKVVIAGTESCGKSTLARYLAKIYNTSYVEEFGRTVCEELGGYEGIMTKELFPYIAYGHKMLEHEALKKANKVVFIDTEAIVTQYYSELSLNHSSPAVDAIAAEQEYDLWLYLEPDTRWVADGLRVYGDEAIRQENNLRLKRMLEERNITYISIGGTYHERLRESMKLVNRMLTE